MTDDVEPGTAGLRSAARGGDGTDVGGQEELTGQNPPVDAAAASVAASEVPRSERPPIDLVAAVKQATWVDALCLGGIVVSVLLGYITLPLAPLLLRHVVPHLLITGSITALLTGGAAVFAGKLPFVAAVLAGVVGNAAFDGFYFWAGRRYGEHVAHFLETWGGVRPRTVARAERWVARFAVPLLIAAPFLPVPAFVLILLTGATPTRWRWFVLADFLGWAAWCATFVSIGYAAHTQVDHIAHLVTHYSRISTIVLVVVIVAVSVVRSSRHSTRPRNS